MEGGVLARLKAKSGLGIRLLFQRKVSKTSTRE
jgi:hypothetical protein